MTSRWQRIRYMPCIPLGEDGTRVTGSPAHTALSRQAAAEGMVLLKNDGELFPIRRGSAVAVFGKAQADYVKGGGGSGDTTVAWVHSLLDGLREKQQEGKLTLFEPLSRYYENEVKKRYAAGERPGCLPEAPLDAQLLQEARAFTDTALITLCRFSGEGWDRSPGAGDFCLSAEETALVEAVKGAFAHVGVVLNVGGVMDVRWFAQDARVQAALLMGQAGMDGGRAAADLLCGDATPSGRLSDTWADFADYPSSKGFSSSPTDVAYTEDIYVGYRYFETIPGAKAKVVYPFGYGLSYTDFALTVDSCAREGNSFSAQVCVKNTGNRPGKEVVQLYCQAPQGRLGKAARVLCAFAKTQTLQPGQEEQLVLRWPLEALASYDDEGAVCASAWVLEAGEYRFYAGADVRTARPLPLVMCLEEAQTLRQCAPRCVPRELDTRLRADGTSAPVANAPILPRPGQDKALPPDGRVPDECPWQRTDNAWLPPQCLTLEDVAEGRCTLDDFMDTLTDEQCVHLLGGQPNRGVANTFGFGNLPPFGVPNVMTADGPAGLRILPQCGVSTTAFPCASVLACTWNEALAQQVGRAAALECRENGIGVWLAPALNIHRNPLCGRNFEYFSEDPLLSGKMAAAIVRGVQGEGMAATVKHFAANNKEENRRECDSRLTERALREIYLKGFEICVREADPWVLMSAYNLINGVRASENRDLLTGILRQEWGFQGVVTTDWYTHGTQWREISAGNDIKMGRGMRTDTLEKMREGLLSRESVRASARRVLEMICKLQ